MKTNIHTGFQGEPSRTAHRSKLTEQTSANAGNMLHFIHKTFWQGGRFDDFEEVEALIESMEHADGLAA